MEHSIDQALQKAVEVHKAGQVQEAARLYRAILKDQPKHPDANHNLGLLAVSAGKPREAVPLLKAALEANPSSAQFWISYINALVKFGNLVEARTVLDQAKSIGAQGYGFDELEKRLQSLGSDLKGNANKVIDPSQDQVQSLVNLYKQGQFKHALKQAENLLQKFPKSSLLFNIQGVVLQSLRKYELSVDAFKRALVIDPSHAATYFNMGISLQEQEQLEEAIKAYAKALAIKPDYADAYINMGNALKDQGQLEESIEAYNKALAIKPNLAQAYSNMGIALKEQGRLEESIEAYRKAIAIKPDLAHAYNNIGNALKEQDKLEDAIAAYTKSLTIESENAEAKYNLTEMLKIYSPKKDYSNSLVNFDKKIKANHNKHAQPKIDKEFAVYISSLLNEIQSVEKSLSTPLLQIYRRNKVHLNCGRHKKIFEDKEIIPEFCFGCYKVQVEVANVLDLIRLAALFYEIEFERDLTRKCLVEVRPNITGSYKGLIYCRGIEQAQRVKKFLDIHVQGIDKTLTGKIKKGCSEFPLVFPEYGEVAENEEKMMQYPQEWRALEAEFDEECPMPPRPYRNPSLNQFCLSDYLIIQKWIDYAKGVGDPTAELFCDLPIKYNEILEVAKARVGDLSKF